MAILSDAAARAPGLKFLASCTDYDCDVGAVVLCVYRIGRSARVCADGGDGYRARLGRIADRRRSGARDPLCRGREPAQRRGRRHDRRCPARRRVPAESILGPGEHGNRDAFARHIRRQRLYRRHRVEWYVRRARLPPTRVHAEIDRLGSSRPASIDLGSSGLERQRVRVVGNGEDGRALPAGVACRTCRLFRHQCARRNDRWRRRGAVFDRNQVAGHERFAVLGRGRDDGGFGQRQLAASEFSRQLPSEQARDHGRRFHRVLEGASSCA